MAKERILRRYTGYFRGWCQAFGEHDSQVDEHSDVSWLVTHDQVGLILSEPLRRAAYRELLAHQEAVRLVIGEGFVQAGSLRYEAVSPIEHKGVQALRALLARESQLHLYLTYHFVYPRGTRIVTFSRHSPLALLYKPIEPLIVELI